MRVLHPPRGGAKSGRLSAASKACQQQVKHVGSVFHPTRHTSEERPEGGGDVHKQKNEKRGEEQCAEYSDFLEPASAAYASVCGSSASVCRARNTLTLSWPMSKICSLRNLRRRNTIAYAAHPLAYAEARTLLWPMNKICSLAYAAHPLAYAEARALLRPMSKICSLRKKKDL
jgi:hypothetical protein